MIDLFSDLSVYQYGYAMLMVGVAGMIHGALGMAFPMVATPLIAILLDVRLAILLTLLPTATVNVASIVGSHNYVDLLQKYWPLFVSALLGTILGSYLLARFDPDPFRLALAVLILISPLTAVFHRFTQRVISRHPVMLMVVFGFLAGVSAGTTNVMLAILIVYLLALGLSREQMIPILNTCFLTGKLTQIIALSVAGLVSLHLLYQTVPLAVMSLLTLMVGKHLGRNISAKQFRKILTGVLAGLACVLIYQFFAT